MSSNFKPFVLSPKGSVHFVNGKDNTYLCNGVPLGDEPNILDRLGTHKTCKRCQNIAVRQIEATAKRLTTNKGTI